MWLSPSSRGYSRLAAEVFQTSEGDLETLVTSTFASCSRVNSFTGFSVEVSVEDAHRGVNEAERATTKPSERRRWDEIVAPEIFI